MTRFTRVVGPKGQIVIPKEFRNRAGFLEGSEVIVELREDEVVLKLPSPSFGSYVDYFIQTKGDKPKRKVEIERLLEDEMLERTGLR